MKSFIQHVQSLNTKRALKLRSETVTHLASKEVPTIVDLLDKGECLEALSRAAEITHRVGPPGVIFKGIRITTSQDEQVDSLATPWASWGKQGSPLPLDSKPRPGPVHVFFEFGFKPPFWAAPLAELTGLSHSLIVTAGKAGYLSSRQQAGLNEALGTLTSAVEEINVIADTHSLYGTPEEGLVGAARAIVEKATAAALAKVATCGYLPRDYASFKAGLRVAEKALSLDEPASFGYSCTSAPLVKTTRLALSNDAQRYEAHKDALPTRLLGVRTNGRAQYGCPTIIPASLRVAVTGDDLSRLFMTFAKNNGITSAESAVGFVWRILLAEGFAPSTHLLISELCPSQTSLAGGGRVGTASVIESREPLTTVGLLGGSFTPSQLTNLSKHARSGKAPLGSSEEGCPSLLLGVHDLFAGNEAARAALTQAGGLAFALKLLKATQNSTNEELFKVVYGPKGIAFCGTPETVRFCAEVEARARATFNEITSYINQQTSTHEDPTPEGGLSGSNSPGL